MENVTYQALAYILLTVISLITGGIFFLFKDYGYKYKNYVDEKLNMYRQCIEDFDRKIRDDTNKRLSEITNEVFEVKDNYIARFDEQRQILHELDIKITKMANDIATGLLKLENQINLIKQNIGEK